MPFCLLMFEPLLYDLKHTLSTQHTSLHLVSVCMHYALGIASVSLCWSRQSWACPTDNHEEEETEELGQQRQQQRGHHRGKETQPRHQLQPLQSGTCKHQLHSVCLLFYFFLWLHMHVCRVTHRHEIFLMVLQLLGLIYLHKREKKTHQEERVEKKLCRETKETSRDLYENILAHTLVADIELSPQNLNRSSNCTQDAPQAMW